MAIKKLDDKNQYESLVHPILQKDLDWQKILICDGLSHAEVLGLALKTEFNSICQSSHPLFEADLNTAAYLASEKNEFIKYPLSAILSPQSVSDKTERELSLFNQTFSASAQKSGILEGISKILTDLKVSSSIFTDGVIIADELVTNAVFNAPFVDLSNARSGVSRERGEVKMHDGKSARIFIGSDESRIIIGCRDPYGSLNLMKFFERIKRCYETGVASNINMSAGGGAGIGSFMVFNAAESFYGQVELGKTTVVCCALPLRMSSRQRDALPKNLHFDIKIKK